MMNTIRVENLTKKFNSFTAVDKISFSIESGKIFGLLGPNGAGKTTTISMLCTLLKPTSGKATVNGFDIIKDEDDVRRSVGIVFQDQSLDEELTAYENMDFHGRLYRITKSVRKKKIIELLKLVELEDRKDNLVKTFSGGMRRRLEIARGLLHEPKVLFLDEPTLGLDPQTRNHLWNYIKGLNKEKKITIILTTHYMEEADKLCDRIAIIDKGKIIAMGTPEELKNKLGGDVITINVEGSENLLPKMKKLSWVKHATNHDSTLTLHLKNAENHVASICKLSMELGFSIRSMNIHKPTLEDVFLHYTGREIREEEATSKDSMRMRARMWRRR